MVSSVVLEESKTLVVVDVAVILVVVVAKETEFPAFPTMTTTSSEDRSSSSFVTMKYVALTPTAAAALEAEPFVAFSSPAIGPVCILWSKGAALLRWYQTE